VGKNKGYGETARRIAGKLARGSLFAMNTFAGVKCCDAKDTASAALAIKAMAHRNLRWLALASQSHGAAMALRGS
jgi:ribose 5-phosphate isomerase RpiB